MSSILDFHPAPNTLAHLSDDEFNDQLIGDLAPAPSAHLAACDLCSDRLAEASFLITSFQDVTAAWSERRSATLPIPKLPQRTPLWQRRSAWIATSFALALGIGMTFTSSSHRVELKTSSAQPLLMRPSHQLNLPALDPAESAAVKTTPPEAQISADNQMLKAVDHELDASADSPAALGLDSANDHANWTPATLSVQD
ncbi:MAG TPA: hypothetical protein VIJ38_19695 [Acidobacteriaceae bacterium]